VEAAPVHPEAAEVHLMLQPRGKAPAGARVKLRVEFGEPPPVPCVLLTDSGRRYDVVGVGGAKTLHCIVMPPGAPYGEEDGPVLSWTWTAKRKRVEP
jgi:hypothetical protein